MTMERTCKPVAAETINKLTFKDKMRAYKRSPLSLILLLLVCGAALITMLTLLYLIFYILVKGIPYITPDLFSFTYTSDNVSLMPALISTIVMTIIALVIALPLGIGAASDWDNTVTLLKTYQSLATDKPGSAFFTNDFAK